MRFNLWEDCNRVPLTELLSFVVDNRGKTVPTAPSGHKLIATNCVTNNTLFPVYEKIRYLSEETYQTWFRAHPIPGDILFVNKGTPGRVCLVPDPVDFCIAQDMIALRADESKIYPKYLFAVLRSREIQQQIYNTNVGDVIPHFKKQFLDQLLIPIPERSIQESIGDLYYVLSLKAERNKKINDNLEQQIEAIFNNKYAPSLCCPNWNVGTIGDVVTLQRGYDLPKDKMVPGSYPVAGSTDTIFYHNDYTTEAPCVVMGRSGNIGKPRLYMERCWAHNTTLFVKDFKGNNPYWSYYMLRSIDYSQFRGGSAVPTLNRNHVHSFEISIPPVNQQNEFGEIILPILLLIENNRKEIKRLSTLREALLPKLMAGEIDISDIAL